MTKPARRILGIDPGLNRTGFGIIEACGATLRHLDSGVLRIAAGDLPQRLQTILRELGAVIERNAPDEAAIEKVFVNVNPQSTLLLGQARGAAICAAVGQDVPVHEYTALQIKQATVGYGHADKTQVQKMVQRLLGLDRAPATDAADALACAICHAHASARLRGTAGAQLAALGAGTTRRASSRRRAAAAWRSYTAEN